MLLSIAIITSTALILNFLFEKIALPGLLGMILAGIILGRSGLDIISPSLLEISSDLKTLALIIILIRAGLGIRKTELNKAGLATLKISIIPCTLEAIFIAVSTNMLLKMPFYESLLLGFIITSISPAIIIPRMLDIQNKNLAENKQIPTMLLAGTSIENVFAITMFFSILGLSTGGDIIAPILKIPLHISLGIVAGIIVGFLLVYLFKKFHIRDTKKLILFITISIFLKQLENDLHITGLIAIIVAAFIILEKRSIVAERLASKFSKVWIFSEIILFVLIGAEVQIKALSDIGFLALIVLLIGFIGRAIGLFASLIGHQFSLKEKIFCVIASIPKATVQAAIGSIPLSMGIGSGESILAISVLSIIVSTPLGIIGIKRAEKTLI